MWKMMKQVNEIVSYLVSVDAKRMISGSIVHTCDLYTPAKPKELSQIWSNKINQEFINQVKEEEKEGLPVTPFYVGLEDLKTRAKNETSFIEFIVMPLWKSLNELFDGNLDDLVGNCESNKKYWQDMLEN